MELLTLTAENDGAAGESRVGDPDAAMRGIWCRNREVQYSILVSALVSAALLIENRVLMVDGISHLMYLTPLIQDVVVTSKAHFKLRQRVPFLVKNYLMLHNMDP